MPKKRDNLLKTRTEPFVQRDQWLQWKRDAASLEYSAAAMAVLESAGKLTRQQYLEMFLDMEARWPGRGWKEAMDDLEKLYHQRRLSLKSKPPSPLSSLFP